jgi:hypothetical protein
LGQSNFIDDPPAEMATNGQPYYSASQNGNAQSSRLHRSARPAGARWLPGSAWEPTAAEALPHESRNVVILAPRDEWVEVKRTILAQDTVGLTGIKFSRGIFVLEWTDFGVLQGFRASDPKSLISRSENDYITLLDYRTGAS